MDRNFNLVFLLAGILSPGGDVWAADPAGEAQPAADGRPNIVLILADDLGWADIGANGSSFYETPNIDRLAREGMNFRRAYAAAPVCSPSRAAILTGQHPARLHTTDYFGGRRTGKLLPAEYNEFLPTDIVTLPEALREAGYATAHIGKWHLGGQGSRPEDHGFEINIGGNDKGSSPGGHFVPYKNPALSDGPPGEYLTDRLGAEAEKFIRANAAGPFFLYFPMFAVHTPLQASKELIEKYKKKAEVLPTAGQGERFGREGPRDVRLVQDHAVYAAMVEAMDNAVGRVLAALDDLDLAKNTIVIFTSDNGGLSTSEGFPTSNLPLRAGKGWLYEGGIRVPLIVRWPGVVAPDVFHYIPVIGTDIFPTLAEAVGIAMPEQPVDGKSFMPVLRGAKKSPHEYLYWHYPHYGNQGGTPSGAIQDITFDRKIIEFYEDDRVELYDLAEDSGETGKSRRNDSWAVRDFMIKRLHGWRDEIGANMPVSNPDYDAEEVRKWHEKMNQTK